MLRGEADIISTCNQFVTALLCCALELNPVQGASGCRVGVILVKSLTNPFARGQSAFGGTSSGSAGGAFQFLSPAWILIQRYGSFSRVLHTSIL
jgi:hypothetical protein